MRLIESHLGKKGSKYLDYLKKDSMPHSFMFVGPKGSLKQTAAEHFARQIILKNDLNPACEKKLSLFQHPDLLQIKLDPKASYHSVASIKKCMDDITMNPFESKVRVVILFDADRMLPPAANALLKTLEEPVSNTVFILLGNAESSFLKTIASRCITISFDLLTSSEIKRDLMETEHVSEENARVIAKYSFGSLEMAKALLLKERPYPQELLLDCIKHMDQANYALFSKKLELFEKSQAKDPMMTNHDVFDVLLQWVRDLEMTKHYQDSQDQYFIEDIDTLKRQGSQAHFCFDEAVEALLLLKKANACNVKLKSCVESFYLKFYQECART